VKKLHSVDPIACLNHDEVCSCMTPRPAEPARPTPTPWETDGLAIIGPSREQEIAICTSDEDVPHADAYANAAIICKAVNSHDDLIKALVHAKEDIEYYLNEREENPNEDTTLKEIQNALRIAQEVA
jgi:hypothetical protein